MPASHIQPKLVIIGDYSLVFTYLIGFSLYPNNIPINTYYFGCPWFCEFHSNHISVEWSTNTSRNRLCCNILNNFLPRMIQLSFNQNTYLGKLNKNVAKWITMLYSWNSCTWPTILTVPHLPDQDMVCGKCNKLLGNSDCICSGCSLGLLT